MAYHTSNRKEELRTRLEKTLSLQAPALVTARPRDTITRRTITRRTVTVRLPDHGRAREAETGIRPGRRSAALEMRPEQRSAAREILRELRDQHPAETERLRERDGPRAEAAEAERLARL